MCVRVDNNKRQLFFHLHNKGTGADPNTRDEVGPKITFIGHPGGRKVYSLQEIATSLYFMSRFEEQAPM